jgi:hypothetical protein
MASSLLCQTPGRDHTPQKIDVSKLGPQVGERVSDFSLKDQNGKVLTLQSRQLRRFPGKSGMPS